MILLLFAGFPIALILAWAFDIKPDAGALEGDAPTLTTTPFLSTGRKLDFLIISALAVALGYFVWERGTVTDSTSIDTATNPSVALTPTIAVLPFVNLSSDPEQDYFSDGLSEELLNQLAQISSLRVTGRTSSFAFKNHNEDLRIIGEKLGVGNILEGSVRKSGNRLRITAQLVNVADGFHLWSETYDRELDDVFAIQESVARAVTAALGATLGVTDAVTITGGTSNLEAYDKYLRARALFYQSGDLARTISIYREALTLDSQFALAWYGLYTALAYTLVSQTGIIDVTLREMEEASTNMELLAPEAWWTQAMRVDKFLQQHRWADAESSAIAMLAAAPASAVDALVSYANFLMYVGRIDEAVVAFQRAREADPLSLRVSGFLQLYLDIAGRPDDAEAEFERSKDLAGGRGRWEWAAVLRLWAREDADLLEVQRSFRIFLETNGAERELDRVLVELIDQPAEVCAAVHDAFEDPAIQFASRMTGIFLYADLCGDKDLALDALRLAFVDFNKVNFEGLWWPFVTDLRSDPRFKEIVREIGLVDYWRTSGKWGDFARPVGLDDFEVIK